MFFAIFVLVLGILIFVHEFGHFVVAKRSGVIVEEFSLGFGPRICSWRMADTRYSICIIPLGGFVKLAGDSPEEFKGQPGEYLSKSVGQRARIIFAGPLLNYILAFFCFWLIFFLGFPTLSCRVGNLVDNFGAQEAGIQPGDKILAVNDQEVKTWEELQNIIQGKAEGEFVNLAVLRNNQRINILVRIKQQRVNTIWGQEKTIGLIGIKPAGEFVNRRYGLVGSFFMAGERLFLLTRVTLKSLLWIAMGRISFRQSVTGPLGIFYITKEAANLGIIPLIQVVAVISMSLAIFNLLPLPVLDGGHLLLLFIEKIRRKRLSVQTERIVTQIGFSIIILLLILVFYNDFLRYDVFNKIYKWWSQ